MRSSSKLLLALCLLAPLPAKAQSIGAQPIFCDKVGLGAGLNAGTTQIIAGISGVVINICGFMLDLNANGTVQLVFGTGSSCTSSTPIMSNITTLTNDHIVNHPSYAWLSSKPGESVCAIVTGTGAVLNADVYYLQRP